MMIARKKKQVCHKCNPLESMFHEAMERQFGELAKRFEPQYWYMRVRPDFFWPQQKISIEIDSREWHSDKAVAADNWMDEKMRQDGIHTIRVYGPDVHKDADTVAAWVYYAIQNYLVGRSMEAVFPQDITTSSNLKGMFVEATQRIYTDAGDRAIEAMVEKEPLQLTEVRKRSKKLFEVTTGTGTFSVTELQQQVYAYLSQHGESTAKEIAKALKENASTVYSAMCFMNEYIPIFERIGEKRPYRWNVCGEFPVAA